MGHPEALCHPPTHPPPPNSPTHKQLPADGSAYEIEVLLPDGEVTSCEKLPSGTQPLISPDECDMAEDIVKADSEVAALLKERYGIEDLSLLACDPWSVHVASDDFAPLRWREDGVPARLVQTFLYMRDDPDDNHYAHPVSKLCSWHRPMRSPPTPCPPLPPTGTHSCPFLVLP